MDTRAFIVGRLMGSNARAFPSRQSRRTRSLHHRWGMTALLSIWTSGGFTTPIDKFLLPPGKLDPCPRIRVSPATTEPIGRDHFATKLSRSPSMPTFPQRGRKGPCMPPISCFHPSDTRARSLHYLEARSCDALRSVKNPFDGQTDIVVEHDTSVRAIDRCGCQQ